MPLPLTKLETVDLFILMCVENKLCEGSFVGVTKAKTLKMFVRPATLSQSVRFFARIKPIKLKKELEFSSYSVRSHQAANAKTNLLILKKKNTKILS